MDIWNTVILAVILKGLNKIFHFSNIVLVQKQRTFELLESMTMDVILVF